MNKKFSHFNIDYTIGNYQIKTLRDESEIFSAFKLRYNVFNLEITGNLNKEQIDHDEFDKVSDHLGIFDLKSEQLIATCRVNCSLFSNLFYTQSEFICDDLINNSKIKLEIGRVCVGHDHRKSIVILLLWKAIAQYMKLTNAELLFGCGSVMTENPLDAFILYKYLIEENKVHDDFHASPKEEYRSLELDSLIKYNLNRNKMTLNEKKLAEKLLPSLCRSYFDIGCKTTGIPAFDREFKCIDFLTILNVANLSPKIRFKLFGNS